MKKIAMMIVLMMALSACAPAATEPVATVEPVAPLATTAAPEVATAAPTEAPAAPTMEPTPTGGGSGLLVFSSNRGGVYDDIYTMRLDGSELTRLTEGESNFFAGPWSPDGSRLLFTGYGLTTSYVGMMNTDGSGLVDFSQRPEVDEGFAAWSPDGMTIALTSRRDGNNEVYIADMLSGGQVRLTDAPGDDFDADFSPDGGSLVFCSDRGRESGVYSLYTVRSDGSNLTRLTNSEGSDYTPAWSPDGTRITFRSTLNGVSDIWLVNADGSNLVNLTRGAGQNWNPAWSPDAGHIVFQTDRDGNWEIYMMNADGSGQVNLTNNAADDQYPYLQPETGGMVPPPAARSD